MRREFHVGFCEGGGVKFPSATRLVIHCRSQAEAQAVVEAIRGRFEQCHLELHPTKTRIVHCKNDGQPGGHEHVSFDFLGYMF
jgi:RNA-directed DNA polymerase